MKKFIIFLILLAIGVFYYFNSYFNDFFTNFFYKIVSFIVFIVGVLAITFPKDYDKVPEIFSNFFKKIKNS